MNHVNSFTFYFDYYNLIDTLPSKDKSVLLIAITDYVFKNIEPKLTGHNQAIFNTLKAQLSLSKNNSKRRSKKELEENQKETVEKPETNQSKTGKEPRKNKTSVLSFKFYISNLEFFKDKRLLREKIENWLDYKEERKEQYKRKGFEALLMRIQKYTDEYGEEKMISLIEDCMASNYQGIIFDKLTNDKKIRSKKPEWFDETIEKKQATEEEQREMNELLKGFNCDEN